MLRRATASGIVPETAWENALEAASVAASETAPEHDKPVSGDGTMLAFACAFTVGVALLEHEPALPDPMWCAALPVAAGLALARVRAGPLLAAVAGYSWAAFVAHVQMGAALPAGAEGRDLEIAGTVQGLPVADTRRVRFDFDVDPGAGVPLPAGGRVRLSWYRARLTPEPGSVWRLTVRLRRPRGWRNPGGSDYEGWLFANRIVATGYIKSARRIGSAPALSMARVHAVRAGLARSIRSVLDGYGSEGLIRALAIGDRSGVSERRWRTLRVTGIAHLMAISGLHIGMAAGATYWMALRVWTLVPRAPLLIAAPQVAGGAAMLAAFGYALLAGLSLPTQRALLMLAVLIASRLSRRCIPPSHGLAFALAAVLIADPHAVRAPGFWLSFVAVAAIVMAIATRPSIGRRKPAGDWPGANPRTFTGRLRTLAIVQIAVTVGLAPVTLSVFAEQSLVSPFVNALVIPLVGAIVVPVVLAGLLVGVLLPPVGASLLTAAALLLDTLWPAVEWVGGHAVMLRAPGGLGWLQIAAAAAGVLIVLAPRGLVPRWLGLTWMLPMLAMRPAPIEPGAYRMTVLDVGHGLAVVVETAGRVLVYDTGPPVGSRLDAAALAVLPYLAWRGHAEVDRVVLSHGDSDHIGGYRRLAESIAVGSTIANGPVGSPRPDAACTAGRQWDWDGVSFEILYPPDGHSGFDNAHSCVIRIEGSGGSTLLTGDVEAGGERALVARLGEGLATDVLVVPHHGSTTSSTRGFIDAVSPSIALFSASEHGRFRLPHPEILSRYVDAGAATYTTSRCGAVTVEFAAGGKPRIVRLEREHDRRYWHVRDAPCRSGAPSGLRAPLRSGAAEG